MRDARGAPLRTWSTRAAACWYRGLMRSGGVALVALFICFGCSDTGSNSNALSCPTGFAGADCTSCYPGYHSDGAGGCTLDTRCLGSSCSGHGVCNDDSGVVSCACEVGYAGDNCAACDDGFHRDRDDACVADESCAAADCGHGTCDDESGVVQCLCDPGYAGAGCGDCAAGFHPLDGDCVLDQACLSSSCAGHGSCNDASGVIVCTCDSGYAGSYCESCDVGHHRALGSGACVADASCMVTNPCVHGTCSDSGGEIACTCDSGYAGAVCDVCAAGFHENGGACALDQQCLSTTCAGHGTCSTSQGLVSCDCDDGYGGDFCQACATGFHRELGTGNCVADESCAATNPCQFGSCVDTTGEVVCSCAPGYAGDTCNICAEGFHADLSGACVANEVCTESTCNGHGSCSDANGVTSCACDALYGGDTCASCGTSADMCGSTCVEATVDQQASDANSIYVTGVMLGQSFVPSRTGRMARISVDSRFAGPASFAIYQSPYGIGNLLPIYSRTLDLVAGPSTYDLADGPVLVAGRDYTFLFKQGSSMTLRATSSNLYPSGWLFSGPNSWLDTRDVVFGIHSTLCP